MRTTLNLDDDVLSAVKELARLRGSTAGQVLSALARHAAWIVRVLKDPDGEGVREHVRGEVAEFAHGFPVPGISDT